MINKNLLVGKYRAEVAEVKEFKCRVKLIGLWDSIPLEDLPWAEYQLEIGARYNEGDFEQCKKGDLVWVEFIAGDSRYPLITGSCFFRPDDIPNLPHELFNGQDKYTHVRAEGQPTPSEPDVKDKISTCHGVLVELTHEGAHRVTHKASGTAIEITKDGELVYYSDSDIYQAAKGDYHGDIIGMFNQKVGKNLNITVKGNVTLNVDGHLNVDKASSINLLQGAGVVTGECICPYTGSPHAHVSSKVKAGM